MALIQAAQLAVVEIDNTAGGATPLVDWAAGRFQGLTLTTDAVLSFGAPIGASLTKLRLTQDTTGGWTVTWPASINWESGVTPTIPVAAGAALIASFYFDGTTYWGFVESSVIVDGDVNAPNGVAGLDNAGELVGPIKLRAILSTDTTDVPALNEIVVVLDSLTAPTMAQVRIGDGVTVHGLPIPSWGQINGDNLEITTSSVGVTRFLGSGNLWLGANSNDFDLAGMMNTLIIASGTTNQGYALMFASGSTGSTTPTNLTFSGGSGFLHPYGKAGMIDINVSFANNNGIMGFLSRRASFTVSKGAVTLGTVGTVGTDYGTTGYAATLVLDSSGYVVVQVTAPDTTTVFYTAKVEVYTCES